MFDDFTWKRGSGELGIIDAFADLAKKASEEAGAEVMVVLNFPQGYLNVVASTPEHPAKRSRLSTPEALARGLDLLRRWLRSLEESGQNDDLRKAIERLKR